MTDEVLIPKQLIHHRPDTVDIFIADLDEDRAGIGEEIAGDGEPLPR